MDSYEAVVETADDGTRAEAGALVVEFRSGRTGSVADLEQLVAYVEEIGEVPSVIRLGADVRLVASDVVSTRV
jgi:hypothetical protein